MKRDILYVSGTRADFGLMKNTLLAVSADLDLSLKVAVTGMHLSEKYGHTVTEISDCGLPIACEIPVPLDETTGASMGRNVGTMLVALIDYMHQNRPDMLLLLGDRGEMLAGALAALHLNIPIAHVHGGERSGTIDEPVRHAISKLSHYHFVTTDAAKRRLVAMGEQPSSIWVTGAPGVEGLSQSNKESKAEIFSRLGLDVAKRTALLVFHPVVQEAGLGAAYIGHILAVMAEKKLQVLAVRPNSDAGGDEIRQALDARAAGDVHVVTHLRREDFISLMAVVDLIIGNTSAGIIEAASFGTRVINVGSRQQLRERNSNVIDVGYERGDLEAAVERSLSAPAWTGTNIYERSGTSSEIVRLLKSLPLDGPILNKVNTY